jgi:large repetitive protein
LICPNEHGQLSTFVFHPGQDHRSRQQGQSVPSPTQLGLRRSQCAGDAAKAWRRGGIFLALAALWGFGIFAGSALAQTAYTFTTPVTVGGSTTMTIPVALQSTGDGTLGAIKVLTGGSATPNLDFTLVPGGGCSVGSSAQTCSVAVQFKPLYPGLRSGAIVLVDSANAAVLATEYLSGTGVGPLSVMEAGELLTVAGNGHLTTEGDSTVALNTAINQPLGTALDGAGDLYFTDSGGNLIRMVTPAGVISTLAGTGAAGFSVDGTLAVNAQINTPSAIVVDGAGNIFFSDSGNNIIREINAVTKMIVTVAGNRAQGYSGDAGPATMATLFSPEGLAIDTSGNLYIADTNNNVIREVTVADGKINTIAGTSVAGFTGDGGVATSATLQTPWGLFATSDGSLYIADFGNNVIRKITAGTITTVAGNGTEAYTGDGGPALQATMNHPAGVAVDAAGDILIADSENNVIRKVNGTTKFISTFAGSSTAGFGGDGLDANNFASFLDKTYSITLDGAGDAVIADRIGLRVRLVLGGTGQFFFQPIKITQVSAPMIQSIENDGTEPLILSAITPVDNAAVDAGTTTCSISTPMPEGSGCNIGVDFAPTIVGTAITGLINVTSNSTNSTGVINLGGDSLSIFPTTTIVTSTPNPSSLNSAVTFTAAVSSPNTAALSGTVNFYDGSTLLGGAAQVLNPTTARATLTVASLTVGTHNITAVYSGDSGDQTSTSPIYVQVVEQSTSTVLTGTPNPSSVFQSVTFTATVSPTNTGGTTPTGSVAFSADGNLLPSGTVELTGGVARYSTALLTQGTHTIKAVYASDTNGLASTSNSFLQTVNLATTSTGLTTNNPTVQVGTSVTFTATVAGVPATAPTGSVIFKNGTTVLGTVPVNAAGVAFLADSTLASGTHTITAVYEGDGSYATSTSPNLTETIGKINTSATVTASANPVISGVTVNFAVTVTAAASTSPNLPISGTVTLVSGTTTLGTGALKAAGTGPATATVTISAANLNPGANPIVANYSGDTNYNATNSPAFNENVGIATSATKLSANVTTVVATTPVTLTAAVSSDGGIPAGSVTFTDGATGIVVGSGALNASGIATTTTTTLAVGTHTITAHYGGNTDDTASVSTAITIVVQDAVTNTSLTVSSNPADFGQTVTLASTVTGNGGTPTGSVNFVDVTASGSAILKTVPLSPAGAAAFSLSTLGNGSHSLTAVYSGDTNDGKSTSNATSLKVLQTVSLAVSTPSQNPSNARADVHFVATLTPLQGIQPTGSITFLDGANILGAGMINGTGATFDTATLAVGTHHITASYAGDATTEAFTSQPFLLTITADGSSIAVKASANPATYGSLVTFTANASSAAGALTGVVIFEADGNSIGQANLVNGVAILSNSTLAPGVHSIVAAYQGDANDQPANSQAISITIERATVTTVSSSTNPQLSLAPFVITATVTNGGSVAPSGTVSFAQDGKVVGTGTLNAAGAATLSVTSLPVGSHAYVATYSGDAVDLTSTSAPLTEAVNLRPTSDVLTSSDTSLSGGQQMTLISVVQASGPTPPTGTVSFFSGTTSIGSAAINSEGIATVTVLLSGTTANLSSTYSGDANYATSTSAITNVTIMNGATFAVTSNPATITMASKDNANVSITLTSLNNFTDTFQIGCLGLPYGATCTFSKNTGITLAAGKTQTISLNIDTANPLGSGAQASLQNPLDKTLRPAGSGGLSRNGSRSVLACFVPGCFLLGLIGLRLRRFRAVGTLLMLLCLAVASSALSGCGTITSNGTPAGTYTFQVNAVGETGVSESAIVTLTVTQ